MKKEFLIDRQGKQFVLYAGLLDLAHESGLVSIQTEAVNVSADFALFKAVVTITTAKDGARTFEGHGDASPANVGRNIAPHFVRMAETRAKARALRDALNIGAASLEELGDDEPDTTGGTFQPRPQARPQGQPDDGAFAGMETRPAPQQAPTPIQRAPSAPQQGQHQAFDVATPAQVRAIYLIGRDQHGMTDQAVDARSVSLYQKPPPELTKKQASDLITVLKAQAS